ncbi:MAG: aminotransferase class III-fold pyridoxal phosphate-dependent enzyme [Gammaproteobacteria bacterium]|jgi:putrescine---pyruvate transaminase|nr:aminotransferase class III-fold pyridoxal phosphate-dependent enzyme [Gammaproteobacteria bacterium]MBT5202436.1 aminotransferase class III-fold pyridoxal phosphate-dependent enzyme [Gammaproteobacteria bacterium]MBT5603691.1 aminotransferase class III-fold pyridoxal phosphate-dependent enzyme [Gammaproteobacteria bacterium]MBT6243783.1 aminotransferase class III-fold pyridoxal phosphate-dependent enzyme [Gammaproteobacteria bacterium]
MGRTQDATEITGMGRDALLHPFTDFKRYKETGGRTYVGGEHIYIADSAGNRILDGMSGLWCTNLGYSQDSIKTAVADQLERLPFYNSFFNCTTDATIRLCQQLSQIFPEDFNHFFLTNSGSEANDTNIRLVHRYFDLIDKPDKKLIISRKNAYHGSTIAAASLGGMKGMHDQFTRLHYVHHIEQPYSFELADNQTPDEFGKQYANKLADKIDELGADNVAAFIAEPVQGAGGVIIPPASYWPEIDLICKQRGILLISDEVICGFGRTGQWFGCQTFGYKPDLISFAKAVTNGYQPLGGVAVSDTIADVITSQGGEFAHGFTYSGHPAACAAGEATLKIYQQPGMLEKLQSDTMVYWQEQWATLAEHPIVGEARSQGLLGALELVRDKNSPTRLAPDGEAAVYCRNQAIENNLMIRQVGDSVISAPPLIINREEIDLLINRLRDALDMTARQFGINQT